MSKKKPATFQPTPRTHYLNADTITLDRLNTGNWLVVPRNRDYQTGDSIVLGMDGDPLYAGTILHTGYNEDGVRPGWVVLTVRVGPVILDEPVVES